MLQNIEKGKMLNLLMQATLVWLMYKQRETSENENRIIYTLWLLLFSYLSNDKTTFYFVIGFAIYDILNLGY